MRNQKLVPNDCQAGDDAGTAWARDVVAGRVPSGALMRGACQRHLRDLERVNDPNYRFRYNPELGKKFRDFCLTLRHYKGEFAGKPVELQPVQMFIFGTLLGWLRKSDGLRRFKMAYIEVPRKQGKSAALSCLSLYMLAIDGEAGAECYTLATKKDQAKIVFGDAIKMMPPALRAKFRERYNQLHFERTNSSLQPLSADSKKLDGLNPHFACADEIHEWPDRALWDVIEDGMGARRQPLIVGITTAGSDRNSFCYTLRKTAVSLAEDAGAGSFIVDSFFGFIAGADPEDAPNWRDPKVWLKANPMLGVSKRLDYMLQQIERCEAEPSKINSVLNKQLNLWTEAESRWLTAEDWHAGAMTTDLRTILRGKRCWGGLDLARLHDLSAFALVFPPDEPVTGLHVATPVDTIAARWKLLVWHWCPVEGILQREQRDRVPYPQWARDGWIIPTPGNVTDFAHLQAAIMTICADYQVQDIGFDRFFASETVQNLQSEGIEMVEFGQGFVSMAGPTSELERLLRGGALLHDGSPLMAWQAGNVVTEMDPAGNLKPSKRKSRERIDGIVAAIMALGRAKVALAEPEIPIGVIVV
jgi:phage terminase large subunit-like protein